MNSTKEYTYGIILRTMMIANASERGIWERFNEMWRVFQEKYPTIAAQVYTDSMQLGI